jgi:predicted transcriptional regulator
MARPRGRTKTARLTVNLDHQVYGALLAIAEREDAPIAWVLRRAVMDFISRQDAAAQPALPLVRSTNRRDAS